MMFGWVFIESDSDDRSRDEVNKFFKESFSTERLVADEGYGLSL